MYFDIIHSIHNDQDQTDTKGFYVGLKSAWHAVDLNKSWGAISSKISQTAQKIRSLITIDIFAQTALLGAGSALFIDPLADLTIAYATAGVTFTLWGAAKALQGDRKTGAMMILGAITLGRGGYLVNKEQHIALNKHRNLKIAEEKLEQCSVQRDKLRIDYGILKDEVTSTNDILTTYRAQRDIALDKWRNEANHKIEKLERLDQCENDLGRSQKLVAKLSERNLMDCLLGKNEFHDTEIGEINDRNRHITFGTTYIKGNELRDKLSKLVDANHAEYAQTWKLEHRVVDTNLVAKECLYPNRWLNKYVDCAPYWNKVALLHQWLNAPKKQTQEEWYILADDDMPVTNMLIDPYQAIDSLRNGIDTSVIIARDVIPWKNGDPEISVNTGLFFVRKDEESKRIIDKLWEKRNTPTERGSDICKTLGTCQNQEVLHEQEAFAQILLEDRNLLNRVITVVNPRNTYGLENQEIALNTFHREGCFKRQQAGWDSNSFSYDEDKKYPTGKWKKGDWMGQTAGVPVLGWWCNDFLNNKPPGPIRQDMLKQMINEVVR